MNGMLVPGLWTELALEVLYHKTTKKCTPTQPPRVPGCNRTVRSSKAHLSAIRGNLYLTLSYCVQCSNM
eukprot:5752227-Amphidinium_carterae.1